jgi:hypothetical protein
MVGWVWHSHRVYQSGRFATAFSPAVGAKCRYSDSRLGRSEKLRLLRLSAHVILADLLRNERHA